MIRRSVTGARHICIPRNNRRYCRWIIAGRRCRDFRFFGNRRFGFFFFSFSCNRLQLRCFYRNNRRLFFRFLLNRFLNRLRRFNFRSFCRFCFCSFRRFCIYNFCRFYFCNFRRFFLPCFCRRCNDGRFLRNRHRESAGFQGRQFPFQLIDPGRQCFQRPVILTA